MKKNVDLNAFGMKELERLWVGVKSMVIRRRLNTIEMVYPWRSAAIYRLQRGNKEDYGC